ncbi:MAG: hypothetical protein PHE68_04885 [Candidatus Peribacteraceae bacterium]|nr:hypothetical protein [Candidatus Peribacteraceae bacterium]MDD5074783.1 hypothetical protein [Candidatus Peribacteraceae bacterium]
MEDVTRIEKNGTTYALIFPKTLAVSDGSRFVSQGQDSLQVGFFVRPEGHKVPPHFHKPRTVELPHIAEFLRIEEGKVKVTVLDETWKVIEERTVEQGWCVLFLRGGHALEMLAPTRIMEVKQGPYAGNDKIFPSA